MLAKLIESGVEVFLEDHVDVQFDFMLHDHEAELKVQLYLPSRVLGIIYLSGISWQVLRNISFSRKARS